MSMWVFRAIKNYLLVCDPAICTEKYIKSLDKKQLEYLIVDSIYYKHTGFYSMFDHYDSFSSELMTALDDIRRIPE